MRTPLRPRAVSPLEAMRRFVFLILVGPAVGCGSADRIPNPSTFYSPGVIQQAYEREHPDQDPVDWSNEPSWLCVDQGAATSITEISLERTGCYGLCSTYTVTLRTSGEAEYVGQANVEKVGRYLGSVQAATVHLLARLADDIGLFSSIPTYVGCFVTDNPTVYISIVKGGVRLTMKHYAPDESGPARLYWFESAVDQIQEQIKWRKAKAGS